MSLKHELQSIVSGNGSLRNGKNIQAITNHLRGKKKTVQGTTKAKLIKEQETQILIEFIEAQSIWYKDVNVSMYIGEGAEQKVYEFADPKFILKLNDSIFYELWEVYLKNSSSLMFTLFLWSLLVCPS